MPANNRREPEQKKGQSKSQVNDVAGNVNDSEDDAQESQGQYNEDGGLEPGDINVADNESLDSKDAMRQTRKGFDDESEIAPNNKAGMTAKSLVAEAQVKGKIVQRRAAVRRQAETEAQKKEVKSIEKFAEEKRLIVAPELMASKDEEK